MTCIVAVKDSTTQSVVLGADSCATTGHNAFCRKDSKLFTKRVVVFDDHSVEMGIGFTTSYRMGQIIKYHVFPPTGTPDMDNPFDYLVTSFVPCVRESLNSHGYAQIKENRETGGEFIVALQGRIFRIGENFQVGEYDYPFWSVGSGAEYALGALHSIRNSRQLNAMEKASIALESAAEFSGSVGEPFIFLTVGDK